MGAGVVKNEEDFITAIYNKKDKSARKMLLSGVNPNAKDNQLNSALILAIQKKLKKLAGELCQIGVDLNVVNKSGYTALMCCILGKKTDLAKLLLKHGANPWVMNPQDRNRTAIDYAENKKLYTLRDEMRAIKNPLAEGNGAANKMQFNDISSETQSHDVSNESQTDDIPDESQTDDIPDESQSDDPPNDTRLASPLAPPLDSDSNDPRVSMYSYVSAQTLSIEGISSWPCWASLQEPVASEMIIDQRAEAFDYLPWNLFPFIKPNLASSTEPADLVFARENLKY